jgi:hypothetical protein
MYRLLFTLLLIGSFLTTFGQKHDVRTQVDSSFSYVKKSWEAANNVLSEIQKCNIATSINEIQSIAAKARTNAEEALSQAGNAETEADGAEGKAQDIECPAAIEGAKQAEKYFKKAKGKFDDAYTKLSDSSDEDRADYLIDYLNSSISVISDGLGYLKKGTEELNKTLKALEGCK